MNENHVDVLCSLIEDKIGVKVKGCVNRTGVRAALSFWFDNYNRGEGPLFSIRPAGLKRHVIDVRFGPFSGPCLELIDANDGEERRLASAFLSELYKVGDVKFDGESYGDFKGIDKDFALKVFRRVDDPHDIMQIKESIVFAMLPMMAMVAELIGYDESPDENIGDVEGDEYYSLIKRRERSQRNRLLCLSVHGERCNACGFVPSEKYGEEFGRIIEVHHIEPLSEVERARPYDPKNDLVPLCPNCHRAIHCRKPALTPGQLKELIGIE